MSYIPDCREDEYYNEKYLNAKDKEFIHGFDWVTEEVVDNFFNNLEDIDSDYLLNVLCQPLPEDLKNEYIMTFSFHDNEEEKREVNTYEDYLRFKLLRWIEDERDEMITSMIDHMDDEEYEQIKEVVDNGGE